MSETEHAIDAMTAECATCDDLVSLPGTVAVVMVNPNGSLHGVVCGLCLWSGRFTTLVNAVIMKDRQVDTPRDDVASPEGSAEGR